MGDADGGPRGRPGVPGTRGRAGRGAGGGSSSRRQSARPHGGAHRSRRCRPGRRSGEVVARSGRRARRRRAVRAGQRRHEGWHRRRGRSVHPGGERRPRLRRRAAIRGGAGRGGRWDRHARRDPTRVDRRLRDRARADIGTRRPAGRGRPRWCADLHDRGRRTLRARGDPAPRRVGARPLPDRVRRRSNGSSASSTRPSATRR